jgi:biopolymer transport protein ExbD
MSKFGKRRNKSIQTISTASLPDIVFMLLFFFMTSTSMKEVKYKVQINNPKATEVKKLENKSLVAYIYVGIPIEKYQSKYGKEPVIQIQDAFVKVSDIGPYINAFRESLDAENRVKMNTALKIDKGSTMGIVTDIKQELRKVNALKITYISDKTTLKDFY